MVGEVCGFFWRRDHVGLVFFFFVVFFCEVSWSFPEQMNRRVACDDTGMFELKISGSFRMGPRKCVISSVIKMSSALGRYFLYLSWKRTARRCHGVAYECKCLCCSETRWLHLDLGKSEASWDSKLDFFCKKSTPKPGNQSKYNWYIYIYTLYIVSVHDASTESCWSWWKLPLPRSRFQ